jgi:hypothetical protein
MGVVNQIPIHLPKIFERLELDTLKAATNEKSYEGSFGDWQILLRRLGRDRVERGRR